MAMGNRRSVSGLSLLRCIALCLASLSLVAILVSYVQPVRLWAGRIGTEQYPAIEDTSRSYAPELTRPISIFEAVANSRYKLVWIGYGVLGVTGSLADDNINSLTQGKEWSLYRPSTYPYPFYCRITIPMWYFMAPCIVIEGWFCVKGWFRARAVGVCSHGGYDLRGSSGPVCSECGQPWTGRKQK